MTKRMSAIRTSLFLMSVTSVTVSCLPSSSAETFSSLATKIDLSEQIKESARAMSQDSPLDLRLRGLARKFSAPTRGGEAEGVIPAKSELLRSFRIKESDKDPRVDVEIKSKETLSQEAIKETGAVVRMELNGIIYATVPVKSLEKLAAVKGVQSIRGIVNVEIPRPIAAKGAERSRAKNDAPTPEKIDRQGYTGKGVLVAIVDTGIDWKHPDFITEDGKSRILYLYDLTSDAWSSSGGAIGSKPPLEDGDGKPWGTLYTNQQIQDALDGKGTVKAIDDYGHGTACAGIAAGNGRATANGVSAGSYVGVAPEADLIIVKSDFVNEDGQRVVLPGYYYAVKWVVDKAKELKRPCSINLSLGSQDTAHDGTSAEETILNSLAGPDKPGVAISVSAGNERGTNLHAGGRFGPRRQGQGDFVSNPIELFVSERGKEDPTKVHAYFDARDDWAFVLEGQDKFLMDPNGKPLAMIIFKTRNGELKCTVRDSEGNDYKGKLSFGEWPITSKRIPLNAQDFLKRFVDSDTDHHDDGSAFDELTVDLPSGNYYALGMSAADRVPNGRFDLYLMDYEKASFGKGSESRYMVGTPGNAKNAITVGSYDYQSNWENMQGEHTYYNLPLGDISDYSCPGPSRDQSVKPDIVAPATYAISSLSRVSEKQLCEMGGGVSPDAASITKDGYHLAWRGTSAAAPYVTGVIALMLQKNSKLNTPQIRDALAKGAKIDTFTGGIPNSDWGYGKIDASAAVKSTKKGKKAG